jgi:hypothetical protein
MTARIVSVLALVLALGACHTVLAGEATDPVPKITDAPNPAEAPAPLQVESTISGCLAKAEDERSMAGASRGATAPPKGLDVTVNRWGLLINHSLQHTCCLSAKIDTKIEKNHITVSEVLSGAVCRCVCNSTLMTRVELSPGDYTVDVVVETNGKVAEPLSVTATVRAFSLKPTPKP